MTSSSSPLSNNRPRSRGPGGTRDRPGKPVVQVHAAGPGNQPEKPVPRTWRPLTIEARAKPGTGRPEASGPTGRRRPAEEATW